MNTILTDDERRAAWDSAARSHQDDIARAIEAAVLAKLREQEPAEEVRRQALDALNWMQSIADMPDGRHPRDVLRAFIRLSPIYAAPLPAVVQVPQGWLDDLRIAMEHSAWDGVLQLPDALANIDDAAATLAAAPEAPALPAEVREALKVARGLLGQSRPYVQYGLHLTELGSQSQSDIFKAADLLRGIDAALARIDALGGGE